MKTLVLLFAAFLVIGCKKEQKTPENIHLTVSTQIWRYDNYRTHFGLDSVKFEFFNQNDSIPFMVKYTDGGTVSISLPSNSRYRLRTTTRSYIASGENKIYHYTTIENFRTSEVLAGETFIQKDWTINYHYPIEGMGSTFGIDIDPTTL